MTETTRKSRDDVTDRQRPLDREKDKAERIPMHMQRSLSFINREPGYRYRFVNDVYGRISMFLKASWTIVEGDSSQTYAGKGREEASQKNGQVWRTVNNGTGANCREAVLMRIPDELYDEDQMAKIDAIMANEARLDPEGKLKSARKFGARG